MLAHVPALNDFVAGIGVLLASDGVATFEFPHVANLVEQTQFDTIYHEHFSYFSILTLRKIFDAHALRIYDVDRLPTHGGSLRLFACLDTPNNRRVVGPETLSCSLQNPFAHPLPWHQDDPTRSEQNPILFPAPDGRLWLLWTAQISGNQDTAIVRRRISTDNGRTWGPIETLFDRVGTSGVFVRHPPAVL